MGPSLATIFTDAPSSSEVLVLGLLLGIGAIVVFMPVILRFLPGLRLMASSRTPVSDSPGCPENYDEALISALHTWPDPNDFLSAHSFTLKDGIRFRHPKMPKCRYFSLSLYAALFDPVQDKLPPCICDHELTYNEDGSFDIAICDEDDMPADIPVSNWMPRQGVRDGLLVVRRYGTLPGQRIDMPSFWSMHADKPREVKPAYTSFSGPQYAEKAPEHRLNRLLRLLAYLGVSYSFLLLGGRWSLAQVHVMIILAAAIPAGFLQVLYQRGRKKTAASVEKYAGGISHEFLDYSAWMAYDNKSTKPHPHHKYYLLVFDANQGDVVITGLLFPGQQKIWTFNVYNEYGMPHYHNLTDETLHTTKIEGKTKRRSDGGGEEEGQGEGEAARAYRIVLTNDMSRHPQRGGNVMDVSGLPRGEVLLRMIYPKSNAVFEKSKPTVTLMPHDKKQA